MFVLLRGAMRSAEPRHIFKKKILYNYSIHSGVLKFIEWPKDLYWNASGPCRQERPSTFQ